VTWCVDQVDADIVPKETDICRVNRNTPLLLYRQKISLCRSLVNIARLPGLSAQEQELLGYGGFTCIGVGHDGNIPDGFVHTQIAGIFI
jgi:hypothetical protein